ncbi:MAG: LysR family transcriptional regulator [Kofleriaceae bacterium]|nr:MAG: LysR family transcriptional regulator [Kofleriaceae bacterium]MBZ0231699.1 LysR family transcriptional regulator [Kofleriaceae bacterium]
MHTVSRRPRPTSVDWGDLQTFLVVCDAGSISGAAARLSVNHSTVLRRIAALERAVATRLFDRSSGSYRLTPAGEELAGGLAGMARRIEASSRHVERRDDELSGEVRLTTTDTLAHGLLMPAIDAFCTRHPGVRVQLIINNHFLSLTRREADIAVRGSNSPPETLLGRHPGDIQTAPYASRAYLASVGRRRKLTELSWIAPDDSLAHLAQARWLLRTIPPAQIVMSIDSLVGMVHAVEHGVGAAMLLCPLADVRKELVRLAEPDPALDTQIWILTHPDLRHDARVRVFSQFLFERLGDDPRLSR